MTYRYLRRVAVVHQGMHWFIIGLLIPILALAQLEKGLSLVQLGFTGTVMSLTVVLLEVPTGGIADTIGRKRTYLISNAVQAGGLLLLAVAGGLPSVTVGLGLFGVARALSSGSIEALFIDEFQRLSPEGNLQPFLARIELAALAGLALGGLVGGYLPDTVGAYLARYRLFDRFAATLLIAALTAALHTVAESPGSSSSVCGPATIRAPPGNPPLGLAPAWAGPSRSAQSRAPATRVGRLTAPAP